MHVAVSGVWSFRVALHSVVPPPSNVTGPVGVPVPGDCGATVAATVSTWPTTAGEVGGVDRVVVVATDGEVDSVSVVVKMLRYMVRSLAPTVHWEDPVPIAAPAAEGIAFGKR